MHKKQRITPRVLRLQKHRFLRVASASMAVVLTISLVTGYLNTDIAQAAIGLRASSATSVTNQITFRGSSAAPTGGASTTVDIPKPSSLAAGDVMVAAISVRGGSGTTITAPSGWSPVSQRDSTTTLRQAVYTKLAGSSESSTYSWTLSSSQKGAGVIMAYSGITGALSVDNSASQANASSTTITAPSVTTSVANDVIVGFFSTATLSTISSTSMTSLRETSGSSGNAAGSNVRLSAAESFQVSAGATGAHTATASAAAVNVGHLVALKPAATGSSISLTKPAGTVQYDVVIAAIVTANAATLTPPSGWTQIQRQTTGGSEIALTSYYHVAGASEPSSYSWNLSPSTRASGVIIAYSGVDNASPIDTSGGQANTSSATVATPNITPTVLSGQTNLIVGFFGIANTSTLTPGSPLVARGSTAAPVDTSILAADRGVTASTSISGSATASSAAVSAGQLVSLTPATATLSQGSHRWFEPGGTVAGGTTWTAQSSGNTSNWRGVAYGNGTFVAVGDGGAVMTSPTGVTWTSQTSGNTINWADIAYGNGLFVAVGPSDAVMTSSDGVTWSGGTGAGSMAWNGIIYANNTFVAAGGTFNSGDIMMSASGTSWTKYTGITTRPLMAVAHGNGQFVAVGGDSVAGAARAVSNDTTISWSGGTLVSDTWSGIAYGNGLFVAVGGSFDDDTTNYSLMTSTNGTSWTRVSKGNEWASVLYTGSLFVRTGSNGTIQTSTNGTSWTQRYTETFTDYFVSIALGASTLVVVGTGGDVVTSVGQMAVGNTLSAQDASLTLNSTEAARLRMNVGVTGTALEVGRLLKLQFASTLNTCTGSEAYYDIGSVAVPAHQRINWGGSANDDASGIATNGSDPTQGGATVVPQQYVSSGNFAVVSATEVGQYAMWDFDLDFTNATYGSNYCFRIVNASDGSVLSSYATIPQVTRCTTPSLERRLRTGAAFCGGGEQRYWSSARQ